MTQFDTVDSGFQEPLVASANEGRAAWQRLGLRLRAVTPAQIVQFTLAAGALTLIGWLAWTAKTALLPFVLGVVLAYVMLPVVNILDRFLPRWIASVLTMTTVTAVIVYTLLQFVPLIAQQMYNVVIAIPTEAELAVYADELATTVDALPAPVQTVVQGWLESSAATIRDQIDLLANRGLNLAIDTVLGLFNALGFIFGFLVIPTWLLTVLNDQKRGRVALDRVLPQSVTPDFWAVARIIDRSFSTFVRGQFFIGVIVGALTYLGLEFIVRLMRTGGDYNLVIALFSGFMALIPTLGPILGTVPVVLLASSVSQETAVAVIIMYVLIWLFVNSAVTPHVEGRLVNIHPALLIIIIVAVSELGFFWVLLAAPLTGILRDLYRYVYGRFADPPRPAGLLPHEPLPLTPSTSTQPQRIPIAYRHGRAQRSASSGRSS